MTEKVYANQCPGEHEIMVTNVAFVADKYKKGAKQGKNYTAVKVTGTVLQSEDKNLIGSEMTDFMFVDHPVAQEITDKKLAKLDTSIAGTKEGKAFAKKPLKVAVKPDPKNDRFVKVYYN